MRRIRLTEEQLHHVIRESVSQILNEIDWKTYDNASRKKYLKLLDMGIPYDEVMERVYPLKLARYQNIDRKYPNLQSALNKNYADEPLTPEEQEELDTYEKEYIDQDHGKYKYEKGGRGYYLDDED